jgi:O-antigen ligase
MILKLWEITFLFFPLLSLEIFRVEFSYFNIPIFFILLILIIISLFVKKEFLFKKINKSEFIFILFFTIFISLHLFNSFRALDTDMSIKFNFKMLSSYFVFFSLSFVFPLEIKEKIFKIIIISSTLLLSLYLYHYYYELHAPFLSIEWKEITEHGKNQLGLYLAIVTPLIYWRVMYEKASFLYIMSLLIHLFSIYYSLSRGTWFSFFIGIIISLFLLFIKKVTISNNIIFIIKKNIIYLIIILGLLFYSYYYAPFKDVFQLRLQSLITLEDYANRKSISMRKSFINDSFEFFSQSPLIGIGTTNFYGKTGYVNHNDYLQVLCEQGLIGSIIFLCMLSIIVINILIFKYETWYEIALANSTINILIYLMFVNAYNTILIYVIFALLLKIKTKGNNI